MTNDRIADLASLARTALTDPDSLPEAQFERLQNPTPDVRATFDPIESLAVIYAVTCLDELLNALEPS